MIVWGRCPRHIDDEVEPNKVLGVTHTPWSAPRAFTACTHAISGAVDNDDLVRAVCIERPDDRGRSHRHRSPRNFGSRVKAVRLPQVVEQSFTVGVVRQHTGPAEDHRVCRIASTSLDFGHACAASTFSGVVTDKPASFASRASRIAAAPSPG